VWEKMSISEKLGFENGTNCACRPGSILDQEHHPLSISANACVAKCLHALPMLAPVPPAAAPILPLVQVPNDQIPGHTRYAVGTAVVAISLN
jgi:hypothetical protein